METKNNNITAKKHTVRNSLQITVNVIGNAILFLGLFDLINTLAIEKLIQFLWSQALSSLPSHYIGTDNILEMLKSPVAVLIGIVIVMLAGLVMLLEISGVYLCVDQVHHRKPFTLWSVLKEVPGVFLHAIKPKNLVAILLSGLILSFVDMDQTGSALAWLHLPEYIMDVVNKNLLLVIAYYLVLLGLLFCTVYFMFSLYYFVVEKQDFVPSIKKGKELLSGRLLKTTLRLVGWGFIVYLINFFIPYLIALAVSILMAVVLYTQSGFAVAQEMTLREFLMPSLQSFGSVIVIVVMISYVDVVRRELLGETEESFKPRKRLFWIIPAFYGALCAIGIFFIAVTSKIITEDPESAFNLVDSTIIAAHRGASVYTPESTMPAFQSAIDSGVCYYIELDVHPTKEGIPIVMHDNTTKRTTGLDARIEDLTLEEIKQLDCGSWFGEEFKGEKVPTLEEVIQACAGKINLIIEIKNSAHMEGFEETVVRMMEQYGIEETSVIHSISYESLTKVKEANPNIACGYIMAIGLGMYYDLPNADFFCIEHSFINDEVVRDIHDRDKKVFAWTVNEPDNVRKVRGYGVDGIIGDDPSSIFVALHSDDENLQEFLGNYLEGALFTEDDAVPVDINEC